ncbi:hypothetical protein HanXRQr2_Chr09g0416181 [Helianthus annuus]|uniref:Uncharacterized protein n=1 Tax=Helianthus annuus TaxID=4232 RepID=A0A9K3NAS8_HELAN|nr:hypothetical protein HanXRQr2_Chr09g0416181 [Helianthus annuus]KAJ0895606.1 hypothetical protein HanPSC8_Chr09g0402471 [Helianthus annuus]
MDPPYRRVSLYTSIHAPRAVQRNPGASLSSFHIRYDSKLWGFLPLLPALRHKRKITWWGNLDSPFHDGKELPNEEGFHLQYKPYQQLESEGLGRRRRRIPGSRKLQRRR